MINGIKAFKPVKVAGVKGSRFIEPHDCEAVADWMVCYKNADKLAQDLSERGFRPGSRQFVILDGLFIFGDLIEALAVRNNWLIEDLTLSTLSLSQDNVDSLHNLLKGGYVQSLNLVLSHHFFSHERGHDGLMPYLYDKLDVDDKLQVAVASVHTKIANIRTSCGLKLTIHGSANLRTSSNIEQIMIEHSPELYDFSMGVHSAIIERHKTINKPVRRNELWQAVLRATSESTSDAREHQPKAETRSAAHNAGI